MTEDGIRVLHMIDAAESAASFVAQRQRADLDRDKMLLFALIRCIEIVGEAGGKVSDAARALAPEIPWRAMVGMRNRLSHAYFDIDTEIVWKTVTVELPWLAVQLRSLFSKLQQ